MSIKSKVFRKILAVTDVKKQTPIYDAEKSKEKLPTHSKSIKFIKFKDTKEARKVEKGSVCRPL